MANALAWPAFGGAESLAAQLPRTLRTERGVWGKVHGARSDFRWIARSPGLGAGAAPLEELIWAGAEEQPARAAFWRAAAGRCLAVTTYPSRAVDRAGRRDFSEKQILEWAPGISVTALPAAAVALLLLPQAALFDDGLWWDRAPVLAAAPELVLPIREDQVPQLELTERTLTEAVHRGLAELRTAIAGHDVQSQLAGFYTAILSGSKVSVLDGFDQPLSGAALAALLLPLPRELADRVSLAGWLFSPSTSLSQLERNWQAVVLPPGSRAKHSFPPCAPDEQGSRLAEALLAGEPPFGTAPASTRRPPARPGPPGAGTPSPFLPPRPSGPGASLHLCEPGPNTPPVLREILRFAQSSDRRWLAPETIERLYQEEPHGTATPPEANALLCEWIEQVAAGRPPYAHEEQWQVKVDLLRALTLALAPSPEIVDRVGAFKSGRVPPLLYAPVFQAGPEMLRDRLGDEVFRWCVEESRRCRSWRWVRWVEEWLGLPRSGLLRQ